MQKSKTNKFLIKEKDESTLKNYKGIESTISVQRALDIPDEALDKYYEISCKLLRDKHYEDAACAFTFLCFLTPLYSSFWQGLGIAEQFQEHYEEAVVAYLKAIETSSNDLAPYANLAQCFLALGEKKAAQFIIDKGLELCDEHSHHNHSIKEKLLVLQKKAGF